MTFLNECTRLRYNHWLNALYKQCKITRGHVNLCSLLEQQMCSIVQEAVSTVFTLKVLKNIMASTIMYIM